MINPEKIVRNKVAILLFVALVLFVGLLVLMLKLENNNRNLKKQANLLGISESNMRDYTNIGCAPWHHSPKDISRADNCYLHTYAYYGDQSEENVVKERLLSNGWVEQKYKPDFFIMPRSTHTLDAVFFKTTMGKTYCAGIEHKEKAFNLHILSSADDNCNKMIGFSK